MFIEVTEILRCPAAHAESYVVCVPIEMDDRRVVRGVVGCPVCGAEFPIADGTLHMGAVRGGGIPPSPDYDAEGLAAFMDLEGRGGYVCLAGATARHANALSGLLPGVHVVTVNAPSAAQPDAGVTHLRAAAGLPLRTHVVRGVALGSDVSGRPWLNDAVRALLPGLRLVVEDEAAEPDGASVLARGGGVAVFERDRG